MLTPKPVYFEGTPPPHEEFKCFTNQKYIFVSFAYHNKCLNKLNEQLPVIYRLKIYALFINGVNLTALIIDSDLLYRGPL